MAPVVPDTTTIGVGFAVVFFKLYDPLTPATLPADTLAQWEAWGNGWTYAGATEDGWRISNSTTTTEQRIEEQSTPVDVTAESKTITVAGQLAQDTIQSIELAAGGGTISTTAAASGQPGKQVLTFNSDLAKFAVGLEAKNPKGFPRRILIPKAVASSDGETSYRRSANKRTYPVTFTSICDPSEIKILEINAAALP